MMFRETVRKLCGRSGSHRRWKPIMEARMTFIDMLCLFIAWFAILLIVRHS